jgi:acyl carrier protein
MADASLEKLCERPAVFRILGYAVSLTCVVREHRVDLQKRGVSQELVVLVKQVLGPASSIPDPLPIDAQLSDLGISSLKMVNLMLAVELEFDIAIPQSDITPENFHSLASIEALVTRTLGQRRSA